MDSRLGLPVNTVLDGSYRITRVVGTGGFGITYEAEDINLATQVAIKEYYPFEFGDRDSTMSVRPKSDRHRQTFDWGRSNFLQEARTLARFEHPSIVRVTRVFEANATAYMVMRFERGESFEAWLRELGRAPTQDELDAIVAPVLDALEMMHGADFLHRDIAPDNIIVRGDGTPVLLDFGAARRAVAEMSRTMTGIVKAGYSPHEQYSSDSRLQGPWSDIYALGGTLYRAVTGHPPEEATLRVDEDSMPTASQAAWKGRYRPGFLAGIDACLRVRHSERPRSVAQLRPMLLGKDAVSRPRLERLVEVFRPTSKPPSKTPSRPPRQLTGRTRRTGPPVAAPGPFRRWPAVAAAVVAVMGGAYGGYEFSRWQPDADADLRRRVEAQRRVEDEAAAKRRAEEEAKRLAEERAREAEARRVAEAERLRREAEAKRLADAAAAAAAKKKADEEDARRREDERIAAEKRSAEAKRLADAEAARKKADDEAAAKRRAEEEAKRLAEERARQAAEAKRIADAAAAAAARKAEEDRIAAERRAAEERARREAEAKRIADAAAAAARKAEEDRIAAAAKKAEEARVAALTPTKKDAPPGTETVVLDAEQRIAFVKRVQELLKAGQCYDGAVNGSAGDAQKALDRFTDGARKKGKEAPGRIELAKASQSDFDTWLRQADGIKGDELCPKPKPVQKEQTAREPRAAPQRPRYSAPSYGGGGGSSAPIQGVR